MYLTVQQLMNKVNMYVNLEAIVNNSEVSI